MFSELLLTTPSQAEPGSPVVPPSSWVTNEKTEAQREAEARPLGHTAAKWPYGA